MTRKYGEKTQKTVHDAMHKYKHGELKSGKSGHKVKSRKQAIAIGLSEARKKGAKVPRRRSPRANDRLPSCQVSDSHRMGWTGMAFA